VTAHDRAQRMAAALRVLSIDAVEQAQSGHPGLPLGAADVATALFRDHLVFDPAAPDWPDRDRFVLSAGHGSMLLYALLHLTGYDLRIEELRQFRQLGSRTAGHPEFGHCPGVETTTGPLGQGLATAVGMALAERMANARFGDEVVDHRTYVLAGDGCLMEGISQEAIDLAGHLRLDRLTVLWDDNQITIDGPTSLSTSTDQAARFAASGWHTLDVDGHDIDAVSRVVGAAQRDDRPTLIRCRTVIGKGAPTKHGTSAAHGSPLGAEEVAGVRAALDWPFEPFEIPSDIRADWRTTADRGRLARRQWTTRVDAGQIDALALAPAMQSGGTAVTTSVESARTQFKDAKAMASRVASQRVLDAIAADHPEVIGGSADLAGSNGTRAANQRSVSAEDFSGNSIDYGIREHAMAAVMNGLALHGPFRPYGGTFLVFADYLRPAMRLSALMGLPVVYVMTHDSIGVGEDGPTHQPVEHLASLRAMPNLQVIRPADAEETAQAWELALGTTTGPTVLVLSRQGLPRLPSGRPESLPLARGGYVVVEPATPRAVTLVATGSEVSLAVAAADSLAADGVAAAVVSLPCFELFDAQDAAYRDEVLGDAPRVGVEAAVRDCWDRYLRPGDQFVGMSGYGASGPGAALFAHFGITAESVTRAAFAAINATTAHSRDLRPASPVPAS
jgi:transketolase